MSLKFTSDKKTLVTLIQPTMSAVSNKNTLPALEGLLFSLKGDELSVCGYDLEKGVKTVTSVRGAGDGEVILNAQKVFAIIRNFPDCDITFAADEKKSCHDKRRNERIYGTRAGKRVVPEPADARRGQ